jgi:hypothetical protein
MLMLVEIVLGKCKIDKNVKCEGTEDLCSYFSSYQSNDGSQMNKNKDCIDFIGK